MYMCGHMHFPSYCTLQLSTIGNEKGIIIILKEWQLLLCIHLYSTGEMLWLLEVRDALIACGLKKFVTA